VSLWSPDRLPSDRKALREARLSDTSEEPRPVSGEPAEPEAAEEIPDAPSGEAEGR